MKRLKKQIWNILEYSSLILRLFVSMLNSTKFPQAVFSHIIFKVFSVCLERELQDIRGVCKASDPTQTEHSSFPYSYLNIISTCSRMKQKAQFRSSLADWDWWFLVEYTQNLTLLIRSPARIHRSVAYCPGLVQVSPTSVPKSWGQATCFGLYAIWPWKSERMETAQPL